MSINVAIIKINWHYDTKVVITKNKDNNTLHHKMKEW